MKPKNLKILLVFFLTTMLLTLITRQVRSGDYDTIYMDSVVLYDTIYMCPAYDSLKFVPLSECDSFLFWSFSYVSSIPPYISNETDTYIRTHFACQLILMVM